MGSMTAFWSDVFGRLTLHSFPTSPITAGAAVGMVLAVIALAAFATYKHAWGWLWRDWFTTVDPKRIGTMYLIVALIMLLRGISDVIMIRAQQAVSVGSNHGFLSSSTFQQIFSAHGTIMIFFVAMGLMFGFFNLIVPLQIGARDVAFPFLNATSFWLYVAGAILINMSLVVGEFSAAGWLAYPPLSEIQYSPGTGVDYWIWSLQIAGIGSLLSGVNFLVTILRLRAPGMNMMRLPMFCWSALGSLALIVFAFPILTVTLTLLALDRTLGFHFFTAGAGGNAMMYVNLIWAWGHPEVYILILPAFGIFSEVVPVFSRKPLFGYTSMVWAIWAIVFLSFTVWLHHFFTMGAGADINAFFGIMTMIIAIPTGVKIFNWLATMYRGRITFATPMLWFLGFVATFTMGGVAGVLMALPPVDFQLHNSLFLVAHFHTMIVGGVVFGFFAGLTYWMPKFLGFKFNERLGRYAFWGWFIGFLGAFIPLYILGIMGATRRLDHYEPSQGWQPLFIVAAIGVAIVCLGIGFQILQLGYSIWKRKENQAGADPWDARTLEWSTPTPVPFYNFTSIPHITSRDQLWADKEAGKRPAAPRYEDIELPNNTPMGLFIGLTALVTGFAIIWHIWWLAILGLLTIITLMVIRLSADDEAVVTNLTAAEVKKLAAGTEQAS